MKATVSALKRLDPALRLVLLYGSDMSASADHARRLVRRITDSGGSDIVIAGATLADDPGALVAAASEIAMFGGTQVVRVEDAGEEVLAAVERLLDAPVAGNLAVIVAGALKKGSKLVARVEAAPNALAIVNYTPDAASAAAAVNEIATETGVRLSREAVAALVRATGGDRGILRQEVTKLALYVDASPERPCDADVSSLAEVGADFADADLDALVDGVAGGDPAAVARQLSEFATMSGIVLLRAVSRRLWLLLDLRTAVDGGASAANVVKSARPPIFWKSQPAIVAQVGRWRTAALRGALARLLEAERGIKRSGSAGDIAIDQLLLGLATRAQG